MWGREEATLVVRGLQDIAPRGGTGWGCPARGPRDPGCCRPAASVRYTPSWVGVPQGYQAVGSSPKLAVGGHVSALQGILVLVHGAGSELEGGAQGPAPGAAGVGRQGSWGRRYMAHLPRSEASRRTDHHVFLGDSGFPARGGKPSGSIKGQDKAQPCR